MVEEEIEEAKKHTRGGFNSRAPDEIRAGWSNMAPEGPLPIKSLEVLLAWVSPKSDKGAYILIQGEFGVSYYLLGYCFKSGRIPIYATSKREVEEKRDGDKVKTKRAFKHVNFRNTGDIIWGKYSLFT